MKKNYTILRFCIWDFEDIAHEQITQLLEINPVETYFKGEKSNPNFSIVAKENGWIMDSGLDSDASFSEQMTSILDILEAKISILKQFSDKYFCEFSCAIFVYHNNDESTPWIHLDSRYNKFTREINVEFDVDLHIR